jgi:hypothetical protein
VAFSVFEASIHVGCAVAVAVLATVSQDAQDSAGYIAAHLAGVLMTVVGAVAAGVLLEQRPGRPATLHRSDGRKPPGGRHRDGRDPRHSD